MFSKAIVCADPPLVEDSTLLGLESRNTAGLFPYGTIISYSCNGALRFEDGTTEKKAGCVRNGFWNEVVFSCDGKSALYDTSSNQELQR